MKRINSLNDLLIEELANLLDAENQHAEILPKMAQASRSSALKSVLEDHQRLTQGHVDRIDDIFSNIGQDHSGRRCKAMQGFIADIEDVVRDPEKYPARDTAIIRIAQRMENFEINGYGTAREHAADLGHTKIVELLDKTLNEERTANFHLNELAQSMINTQAIEPKGGFYIPERKFGRKGIKKKTKSTEVSRFISEGNPNIQEPEARWEDKGDIS